MDRVILIVSTICFLAAVVHTVIELRGGVFRPMRFNFFAFALACIAGVMYLVQERQLKTHQLHSIFYHLPPLTDLFAAITRLLWLGFALYTLGIVSGFFTGRPLPHVQVVAAIGVWLLYAAILQGRHLRRLAPKRVAALCIIGFTAALTLLWGITFSAQTHSMP